MSAEQMHEAFKAWLNRPCKKSGKTLPEVLDPALLKIAAKGWTDGWADALATQPQAPQGGVTDANRLEFISSSPSRYVEQHPANNMWRVYQDMAPPTAVAANWVAMTPDYHNTPSAAIDAAMLAAPTETPEVKK